MPGTTTEADRRAALAAERRAAYRELVQRSLPPEAVEAPELDGSLPALGDRRRRDLLEDYAIMLTARELDKLELALQKQGQVWFTIAGAGKEAINVAFGSQLSPEDAKLPYYRDRALALACGVSPYEMLLQAMAKASDPASGGRQMPSHWGHADFGIVSQSSPTGSQCIPAVGLAEGFAKRARLGLPAGSFDRFQREDAVVYVSLGEGTTAEGEVEEALKEACRTGAPVIFVVEDDAYAISTPARWNVPGGSIRKLYAHYGPLGLRIIEVDGTNLLESRRAVAEVVAYCRKRKGPALVHAHVTRPMSHSSTDTQSQYRPPDEIADDLSRDPLPKTRDLILAHDPFVLVQSAFETALLEGMKTLEVEIQRWVRAEAERARAEPPTDAAQILRHRFAGDPEAEGRAEPPPADAAEPPPAEKLQPAEGESVEIRYALNAVLREALAEDPRTLIFGEDVADVTPFGKRMKLPAIQETALEGKGGVFHVTRGLQKEFGPERVWSSALAEATILGMATGYALAGFRPIPEIQFRDYVHPGWQQLIDEAATLRWRSNGAWTCPMVVRMAYGGYLSGAGALWHSEASVGPLAHAPGVRVVVPSNAWDAAGLLRAALASDEIVLFLEPKAMYSARAAAAPAGTRLPLGRAQVVRPGEDLTLVTYGNLVARALVAAEQFAALDISIEVIDLRTVDAGWDQFTVGRSLARTGRLVMVDEDRPLGGFGEHVLATLAQTHWGALRAAPLRICAQPSRVSYGPAGEAAILPQVDGIVRRLRDWLLAEAE